MRAIGYWNWNTGTESVVLCRDKRTQSQHLPATRFHIRGDSILHTFYRAPILLANGRCPLLLAGTGAQSLRCRGRRTVFPLSQGPPRQCRKYPPLSPPSPVPTCWPPTERHPQRHPTQGMYVLLCSNMRSHSEEARSGAPEAQAFTLNDFKHQPLPNHGNPPSMASPYLA